MRTLVAILAISSGLLHAQQTSPAQPVSTPVSSPVLLAAASPLPNSPAAPAYTGRISTGVVAARLVHTVTLDETNNPVFRRSPVPRTVALHMTVNAAGKPQDLTLIRSSDAITAREVLDAVARFRYQPATVNGVPTAQSVNLEVNIDTN